MTPNSVLNDRLKSSTICVNDCAQIAYLYPWVIFMRKLMPQALMTRLLVFYMWMTRLRHDMLMWPINGKIWVEEPQETLSMHNIDHANINSSFLWIQCCLLFTSTAREKDCPAGNVHVLVATHQHLQCRFGIEVRFLFLYPLYTRTTFWKV